jgi:uncharacterized protein YyaL (SSP411 family)
MTGHAGFRASADRTLEAFGSRLVAGAVGVPQMLVAYEFSLAKPKQIILAGESHSPGMPELVRALYSRFTPHRIVLRVDEKSRATLARFSPAIQSMQAIDGQATAYVCENYACQLPTSDVATFVQLIQ